jgi:flagellar basal body-associated protein FliL
MIAVLTVLAQNSQDAPEEGVGLGLILLGVLIALAIAIAIFMVFSKVSKSKAGTAPDREPHDPGHVGH